uniref:Uncharacterized protein n=1 Tax=Chromera velia CCMP2878 TaxID=1169474 RepID=A0A0G4G677_9ALVE|eukprot:Cvel_20432.t1-p1 / transcript=Cvel_20432.t1 / gene=Cvel_20432 / organism=Chromera_velia_CCMP2878 / gene_product=hypothetical protein / transcript_product=hypothetical protein / location=Cvel_scaffold1831:21936-22334(+) / protein_length=133 / sequence_SO=supercontig / SO=protein_coding / is_pseudo=false
MFCLGGAGLRAWKGDVACVTKNLHRSLLTVLNQAGGIQASLRPLRRPEQSEFDWVGRGGRGGGRGGWGLFFAGAAVQQGTGQVVGDCWGGLKGGNDWVKAVGEISNVGKVHDFFMECRVWCLGGRVGSVVKQR